MQYVPDFEKVLGKIAPGESLKVDPDPFLGREKVGRGV